MIVVLGVMLIFTLLVTVTLASARNFVPQSRRGQDWPAALAAAQAGVDEYIHRLNVDDHYWTNGGVDNTNLAFTSYINIPGTGNSARTGRYTYSVISTVSFTSTTGTIRLKVTGRVNNVYRTLVASINKPGFLKYVDFTDYAVVDPLFSQFYDTSGGRDVNYWTGVCGTYYWNNRQGGCSEIYFGPSDVENGPVHWNDAPMLGGHPLFTSPTTETSWPDSGTPAPPLPARYRQQSPGSSPSSAGFDWVYAPLQTMPPSNSALISVATTGGCLYTGPTQIVLNAAGTMTVLSPYTLSTNAGCYNTATASTRNTAQTVPLPANGVAYVQAIPTSGPNYSNVPTCPAQELGQYPQANDSTPYDCHAGDVFVQGSLKGKFTIAADNNINITGNTTYQGGHTGTDVLGFIANNLVQIYHPVHCSNNSYPCGAGNGGGTDLPVPANGSTAMGSVNIDAALLSLKHCFTVQNWQAGAFQGNRTVFGSIAEKWAAVSSYGGYTGYNDNFNYDSRLLVTPPPYFLQPDAAAWQVVSLSEQKP